MAMEVKTTKRLHLHSLPLIALAFVATMATAMAVAAANNVPPSQLLAHPSFQTKELSYGVAVAAPKVEPRAAPVTSPADSPVVTIVGGTPSSEGFTDARLMAEHTLLTMTINDAFNQAVQTPGPGKRLIKQ